MTTLRGTGNRRRPPRAGLRIPHTPPGATPIVALCMAAACVTGCGRIDAADRGTGARPPARVDVTVAVARDGVRISPRTVGAGPLRLLITNATSRPVRPELLGPGAPATRTRSAIAPDAIDTIETTVTRGRWRVSVAGGRPAATLSVSAERDSSDSELLLP